MSKITVQQLLNAGVHFGHLRRKWNPQMAPYIFMEKNGIHIIDLNKTVLQLEDASNALKQMARSGKKILFVGTKKQAKDIIAEKAKGVIFLKGTATEKIIKEVKKNIPQWICVLCKTG